MSEPAPAVSRAFVLAAGLGKRMRPVTATVPKPLVEVAGKALLDHALDRVAEAGIGTAVVNVHYLADLIEGHLAGRTEGPATLVSGDRGDMGVAGGGKSNAMPLVGAGPIGVENTE
jgi:MurNAc alpha-1-phosphate uridylyltransferase